MAGSEHDDEEHPLRRRRSALLRREWQLSLYPQAAEAGGCLVTTRSGEAAGRAADPERAAAEAIRRARAKIRRYGIANRLNRLATLTFDFDRVDWCQVLWQADQLGGQAATLLLVTVLFASARRGRAAEVDGRCRAPGRATTRRVE